MFGRIKVIVGILCTAGIYCTLLHYVSFQKCVRLNHSVSFSGFLAHCPRRPPPLLTYLLTPWCRVLLKKLTGLQLVKKFAAFYGTRKFITGLTSVRHPSLSWASPIQSIYPHLTSWRSILILSTHLRLSLPSGLFPSGFLTKTLYAPLSSPIRTTCPAHLILLDFITRTKLGEEYKSFSSSFCSLLHSPVTSSILGPNILLNTTFSNTLSFLSSLNVSDQVSHPYKTIGKIIVLYILIFTFLDINPEDKNSAPNDSKHFLTSIGS